MKIVLNKGYGGFCLSVEATRMILERKNIPFFEEESHSGIRFYNAETEERIHMPVDIDRRDPDLIAVVEALGDKACGRWGKLVIEDIPSGTAYMIDEYDGIDWIQYRDTMDWCIAT